MYKYNNNLYLSKLDAQWASFFENLKIEFVYDNTIGYFTLTKMNMRAISMFQKDFDFYQKYINDFISIDHNHLERSDGNSVVLLYKQPWVKKSSMLLGTIKNKGILSLTGFTDGYTGTFQNIDHTNIYCLDSFNNKDNDISFNGWVLTSEQLTNFSILAKEEKLRNPSLKYNFEDDYMLWQKAISFSKTCEIVYEDDSEAAEFPISMNDNSKEKEINFNTDIRPFSGGAKKKISDDFIFDFQQDDPDENFKDEDDGLKEPDEKTNSTIEEEHKDIDEPDQPTFGNIDAINPKNTNIVDDNAKDIPLQNEDLISDVKNYIKENTQDDLNVTKPEQLFNNKKITEDDLVQPTAVGKKAQSKKLDNKEALFGKPGNILFDEIPPAIDKFPDLSEKQENKKEELSERPAINDKQDLRYNHQFPIHNEKENSTDEKEKSKSSKKNGRKNFISMIDNLIFEPEPDEELEQQQSDSKEIKEKSESIIDKFLPDISKTDSLVLSTWIDAALKKHNSVNVDTKVEEIITAFNKMTGINVDKETMIYFLLKHGFALQIDNDTECFNVSEKSPALRIKVSSDHVNHPENWINLDHAKEELRRIKSE